MESISSSDDAEFVDLASVSSVSVGEVLSPAPLSQDDARMEIHFGVFGKRSVGKSTLLQALFPSTPDETTRASSSAQNCDDFLHTVDSPTDAVNFLSSFKYRNAGSKSDASDIRTTRFSEPIFSAHNPNVQSHVWELTLPSLVEDSISSLKQREELSGIWDALDCVIYVREPPLHSEDSELWKADPLLRQFQKLQLDKGIPFLVIGNERKPDFSEESKEERKETVEEPLNLVDMVPSNRTSNFISLSVSSSEESTDTNLLDDELDDFDDIGILAPPVVGNEANAAADIGSISTTLDRISTLCLILSAEEARLQRQCSGMSFDRLLELDERLVNQLGQALILHDRWHLLTHMERVELLHNHYGEGRDITEKVDEPFAKLLSWIKATMGSSEVQARLLLRQQEWNFKTLQAESSNLVFKIRQLYLHRTCHRAPSAPLHSTFWAFYRVNEQVAVAALRENVLNVQALQRPVSFLLDYSRLLQEAKWENQKVVEDALEELVHRQIGVILQKRYSYSFTNWYHYCRDRRWQARDPDSLLPWEYLSPPDWATMVGSLLLVGSNPLFVEKLGREKMQLRVLLQQAHLGLFKETVLESPQSGTLRQHISRQQDQHKPWPFLAPIPSHAPADSVSVLSGGVSLHSTGGDPSILGTRDGCPSLVHAMEGSWNVNKGIFYPKYPKTYACLHRLHAPPGGLSDTNHWGHVAWEWIRFHEDNARMAS